MSSISRVVSLTFVVHKFKVGVLSRCMLVHAETSSPSICVSLYEATYSKSSRRYKGTINTVLHHVAYLFTWAENNLPDLECRLLKGCGVDFHDIKKFGNWLDKNIKSKTDGKQVCGYPREIMGNCKRFVIWFVESYAPISSRGWGVNYNFHELIKAHELCWLRCMSGNTNDPIAPNITDEQLCNIETILHNALSDSGDEDSSAVRNYLIYRLIRAFGLRIGEALALRLSDLNLNGAHPSLEITRIDERGAEYQDPRSPYHPKVKTLSRLLYFDPSDKDLLALLEQYISFHRVKIVDVGGERRASIFLGHDFIFIEYGDKSSARPLSCSAATKIASSISAQVGFKFHWHVLRHATFNRLYEAASNLKDNATEMDHIVYVGGWASSESLRIYARRAIRDSALRKLNRINQVGASE